MTLQQNKFKKYKKPQNTHLKMIERIRERMNLSFLGKAHLGNNNQTNLSDLNNSDFKVDNLSRGGDCKKKVFGFFLPSTTLTFFWYINLAIVDAPI